MGRREGDDAVVGNTHAVDGDIESDCDADAPLSGEAVEARFSEAREHVLAIAAAVEGKAKALSQLVQRDEDKSERAPDPHPDPDPDPDKSAHVAATRSPAVTLTPGFLRQEDFASNSFTPALVYSFRQEVKAALHTLMLIDDQASAVNVARLSARLKLFRVQMDFFSLLEVVTSCTQDVVDVTDAFFEETSARSHQPMRLLRGALLRLEGVTELVQGKAPFSTCTTTATAAVHMLPGESALDRPSTEADAMNISQQLCDLSILDEDIHFCSGIVSSSSKGRNVDDDDDKDDTDSDGLGTKSLGNSRIGSRTEKGAELFHTTEEIQDKGQAPSPQTVLVPPDDNDVCDHSDSTTSANATTSATATAAITSLLSSTLASLALPSQNSFPVEMRRALAQVQHSNLGVLSHILADVGITTVHHLMTLSQAQLKCAVEEIARYVDEIEVTESPVQVRNGVKQEQVLVPTRSSSEFDALHLASLRSPIERGLVTLEESAALGQGKYGSVYSVTSGEEPVAIKMVKVKTGTLAFASTMRVVDEAKTLMRLSHPNIVKYLDVFGHRSPSSSRDNFVCIVMELCNGGSLSDVIFDSVLSLQGAVDIIRQLTHAIAYIHDCGIIHCDVKLENILVKEVPGKARDLVKLGDFGLSKAKELYFAAPPPEETNHQEATRGNGSVLSTSPKEPKEVNSQAGHPYSHTQPPCNPLPHTLHADPSGLVRSATQEHDVPLLADRTGDDAAAPLRPYSISGPLSSVRGTTCYQPPECFLQHGAVSVGKAVDMWAFGCLIWEVVAQDCLPMGSHKELMGYVAAHNSPQWASLKAALLEQLHCAYLQLPRETGRSRRSSSSDSCPNAEAEGNRPAGRSTVGEGSESSLLDEGIGSAIRALVSSLWSINAGKRPSAASILVHYDHYLPEDYRFKVAALQRK